MDKTCSIVQDLLPLYEEDMLREETKEFVDGHLAQCAACRAELDALKADVKPAPVSAQPLRDLKRQLRRKKLTAVLLAVTLALRAYAGVVGRLRALLRLLIPLALIMLVLQLAFMRDGNIVWGFVTDTGLITGSKACLRLLGVALPLILMLMVTKLNDLANACVEVLHVPYRYAFTFTTALRFVPVFGQEMNAIMEAQTARGVEYDTKNPVKKLKLMLPLCVPLLISSVGKTDATALAAEQRGFYLRTRASSYKRYPIKGLDIAVLIVSIALIAIGFLF